MGVERLAVEFERRDDGSVSLRVAGKLERTAAALLNGVLQAVLTDPAPIVLDLSSVEHIDSRGLEVLLDAEAEAARRRASVEVIGVPESLRAHRPRLE